MSKNKIKLDPNQYIVSKTDTKGIITYVNDYFMKISGYTQSEMIGQPHNIIRHPDMPKVIFKLLWKNISAGKDMHAVIKNRAKNGDYYWVLTAFEIHYDADNNIDGYTAYRRGVNSAITKKISKLYSKLLEIERQEGTKASEKYLKKFLDKKKMSYDQYVMSLISNSKATNKFFAKMKKLFS